MGPWGDACRGRGEKRPRSSVGAVMTATPSDPSAGRLPSGTLKWPKGQCRHSWQATDDGHGKQSAPRWRKPSHAVWCQVAVVRRRALASAASTSCSGRAASEPSGLFRRRSPAPPAAPAAAAAAATAAEAAAATAAAGGEEAAGEGGGEAATAAARACRQGRRSRGRKWARCHKRSWWPPSILRQGSCSAF